jgi:hypothetical protein
MFPIRKRIVLLHLSGQVIRTTADPSCPKTWAVARRRQTATCSRPSPALDVPPGALAANTALD